MSHLQIMRRLVKRFRTNVADRGLAKLV